VIGKFLTTEIADNGVLFKLEDFVHVAEQRLLACLHFVSTQMPHRVKGRDRSAINLRLFF
jgi:hypothetical protein